MGALEQLAALLVQQHALQHPAAAASPAPAAPSGVATGQSPALPKGPFESASNGAHASGSTAQQCSSGPTGSVLGAALASLLQQRCSEPAAIQLDAMSRDSSHDFAPTAAAAVAAATNAAAAATAEDDAAHGRMLELAKAVAQVIITQVQAHPSCMALKRMGAAISETLLKCVAPSGLASLEQQQQQKEQAAAAAAAQQQEQQQNLLLAALLHPALVASAGASGGTGSIWDASHEVRSSTGSATDALLAAAINQQLQQQQQQQDKAPFRPHATRAGSDHTTDTPGAWPLLLHAAPVPHGAPRQANGSSPTAKRQRKDPGGADRQLPFLAVAAPRAAGGSSGSGAAPAAAAGQPLVPLVQGSGPGSPAAAVAAAAAAAAAAALRPLAAREQAIPRQVPATLRRDVLAASLRHPLAAVDRLLTNATYMNRLHVNQNMAHDLLPDVEEIVLPKEQQRHGAGGSLMLFKHSIVVVDEQDRAWPVQYEGFMSAGQRHLRLGAGWRYLCRANSAAVGDTLVLERWTPDRSVVHLRITRPSSDSQQRQQQHPSQTPSNLSKLPLAAGGGTPGSLPGLEESGPLHVSVLPPQLQAMLGVAEAEAAAAAAPQQQQEQQEQGAEGAGDVAEAPAAAAGVASLSTHSDTSLPPPAG